jgi:hypothetical protein
MAQSLDNLSRTWSDAGTTFTAIKYDITDSGSAAGSLLMDLRVGGESRFKTDKDGQATFTVKNTGGTPTLAVVKSGSTSVGITASSGLTITSTTGPVILAPFGTQGVFIGGAYLNIGPSDDVRLLRDAGDTLALRRSTVAQAFRLYGTYTDASNYERGSLTANSDGFTLGHEAAGSGTKRPVRILGPSLASAETASALEVLQTWDTTGTPTALKVQVTDTDSSGSSLLMDLRVGVTSRFYVVKNGDMVTGRGYVSSLTVQPTGGYVAWRNEGTFLRSDADNVLDQRNSTNAQESRIYGSYTSAAKYQRMSVKTVREVTPALTSGSTYVSTIAIPAYAHLVGVTTRVNTAITGATTYSVGDGTDADLWGASIPIAVDSESRTADFTDIAAVGPAATARTVTLTANGSDFTAGVVEICLHYLTTEAD